MQYIFVTNPQNPHSRALQQKLSQDLPQTMHATFVTLQELAQQQPSGPTRVVYLGIPPVQTTFLGLPDAFRSAALSGLFIDAEHRKITFYTQKDQQFVPSEVTYAGDATLYAALFTTDSQVYSCGVSHALTKLAHIAEIYQDRASALTNDMSALQRSDCVYPEAVLQEFSQTINAQTTALIPNLIPVEAQAQQLVQENENLRLQSCPELY